MTKSTTKSLFLILTLWLLGEVVHQKAALALNITAEGEIEGDYEALSLNISISRVKAEQVQSEDLDEAALSSGYIDVILPNDDSAPILRKSPSTSESTDFNENFYWEMISADMEPDSNNPDEYQISYTLKVISNPSAPTPKSLKDIKESAKEAINVKVRFNPSKDGVTFDTRAEGSTFTFLVERISAKPNEEPQGFTALGVYRGIAVNWTVKDSVQYTNSSVNRKPSSVVVMTFKQSATTIALKAKEIDEINGDDQDTTCSFVGGQDCISCPSGNVYITDNQTTSPDGLAHIGTYQNSGSTRINNLDPESTYTVVMQYKDGVKRTKCIDVAPSENITLTELNGDKSEFGDPRCFIVSATYGSPWATQVAIFRWFRDKILASFSFGPKLIEAYYENSQPLAEWISESDSRKSAMQALLWLPSMFLHGLRFITEKPWLATLALLTLLTLLSLAGLFYRFAINPPKRNI